MIYYSPEKRGFYDSDIHANIPPDAIELKPGEHENLLAAQSAGKAIVPSASGPVAADPVPSTEEALVMLRLRRDRLLRQSDFTQVPDAPLTQEQRAAWAAYRQALRDLPQQNAADPLAVIWPEAPGA